MENTAEMRKPIPAFSACVKDCAGDEHIIEAYNRLYGTKLRAPIAALLSGPGAARPPNSPSDDELGRFILFCYDAVWRIVLTDPRFNGGAVAADRPTFSDAPREPTPAAGGGTA